jgi:hypothetical protein
MLDALLDRQRQLIRRDQLPAAGVSLDTVRWRIRSRRWQRVLPGLYAAFPGALDANQRLTAALLHAGDESQVTGAAALRWHGFRYVPRTELVHVLVPHTVRRSSAGFVVVQRTTRLDPMSRIRGGLRVCSVVRAVADAARASADLTEVRACVAEAVQGRRTTPAELFAELDGGPTPRSALLRSALAEIAAGARSAPEAELRAALAESDVLPVIHWNPRLVAADGTRMPTPDGWIVEVGIALEMDSREYHLTPAGWEQTMRRHNLFARHGALVLHFTPAELRRDPSAVRAAVESAYVERLRTISSFTAIRMRGAGGGTP